MALDIVRKEGTERCSDCRNKSVKKDWRVKNNSQVSGIKDRMEGKTIYEREKTGVRTLFIREGMEGITLFHRP